MSSSAIGNAGSPARWCKACATATSEGSRSSAQCPAAAFEQWTPSSASRQIRQAVSTMSSACLASSVKPCHAASCRSPTSSSDFVGTLAMTASGAAQDAAAVSARNRDFGEEVGVDDPSCDLGRPPGAEREGNLHRWRWRGRSGGLPRDDAEIDASGSGHVELVDSLK
jgi:hypothetical protein